jgi:hypothetical protein
MKELSQGPDRPTFTPKPQEILRRLKDKFFPQQGGAGYDRVIPEGCLVDRETGCVCLNEREKATVYRRCKANELILRESLEKHWSAKRTWEELIQVNGGEPPKDLLIEDKKLSTRPVWENLLEFWIKIAFVSMCRSCDYVSYLKREDEHDGKCAAAGDADVAGA